MNAFDIRITGEADEDKARAVAGELIGELLAGGGRVHHASMNGQEIRIHIDRVEVASPDPDEIVGSVSAAGAVEVIADPAAAADGRDVVGSADVADSGSGGVAGDGTAEG